MYIFGKRGEKMLPSEEKLKRFANAESPAPGSDKPESTDLENKDGAVQPNQGQQAVAPQSGSEEGKDTTKPNPAQDKGASGSDTGDRSHLIKGFEKRLNRQERSHQREKQELLDRIKQLEDAQKKNTPELTAADFDKREDYDAYKREQMRKEILEELRNDEAKRKAEEESTAKAEKRLAETFKNEDERAEFQELITEFCEDHKEFLATENGQAYESFIDASPVGLIVAQVIAKSTKATERIKGLGKDIMLAELKQVESAIIAKAKAMQAPNGAQGSTKETAQNQQPAAQKMPPTMPNTGAIGGAQNAPKFSGKQWLRENHPERYR